MSETDNKIIEVQEIVFRQLQRLDDKVLMESNAAEEISRSNVISNNAQTFIKAVNLNLKIREFAQKQSMQVKNLTKELGL